MKKEIFRQSVHISGLFFVMLAYFIEINMLLLLFFSIAALFLLYSEYVRRGENKWVGIVHKYDVKFRDFATWLERSDAQRPFTGAFWFYMGCGTAFLMFPMDIAVMACMVLAVSDSLSTIAGKLAGGPKIAKEKTIAGSGTFFFTSFAICLFFIPITSAFLVSSSATLAEILPGIGRIRMADKRSILNDNWIVPVSVCVSAMLLAIFL